MKITKTTPILSVENIETSLPFWTDILGYKKTVEVPHNDRIGFVILEKDNNEIMLQTPASLSDDLPLLVDSFKPGSVWLYSDVDSIDAAVAALKGVKIVVPLRTTNYGAKEIWVRNLDGNILGFAELKR